MRDLLLLCGLIALVLGLLVLCGPFFASVIYYALQGEFVGWDAFRRIAAGWGMVIAFIGVWALTNG